MRQQLREWQEATVDALHQWGKLATTAGQLTEAEMIERYQRFHQGNPRALIEFARREAPSGADPITEAQRYEQRMEAALRRQQNG
jgi:hypothetical protein